VFEVVDFSGELCEMFRVGQFLRLGPREASPQ